MKKNRYFETAFFLFALTVCVVISDVHSQVRIYPIFTAEQKITYGAYQDAEQSSIYHLATELTLLRGWDESWSLAYRKSGINYRSGFRYSQNQFVASTSHALPVGNNLLTIRADGIYITSNSDITQDNPSAYAQIGYSMDGFTKGFILGGFMSWFPEVKSSGFSVLYWTMINPTGSVSIRLNRDLLSEDMGNGTSFFSGSIAWYQPILPLYAFLTQVKIGKRSLFYDQDIKLVYNTDHANTLGGSVALFIQPTESVMFLADISYDRFGSVGIDPYAVLYYTLGARVTF